MSEFQGLASGEAREKLKKYGLNEISKEGKFSWWRLLLVQFGSPLVYVLLAAGVLSLALAHYVDAGIILAAVFVNVSLGFYQEFKAEKSLEALKKMISVEVEVLRNGKRKVVPMKEVVPGDVVFLKMGDKVPADGVVLEADKFSVNEAVLTGESVPVEKEVFEGELREQDLEQDFEELREEERVYMGTTVVSGVAKALVVNTGDDTEMGKIAERLKTTEREKTVLQEQLAKFSKFLTWVLVGVSLLLFVVGVLRGESWLSMFLVSVAVAVSAIPEGLVVALTAILAVGMQRILRRRGLVRKLLAAEALGSVDLVCADKTGTLTEGKMKVVDIEGEEVGLSKAAVLSNELADPLEVAMMEWGKSKVRVKDGEELGIEDWERVGTLPFNPNLKYGASVVEGGEGKVLYVRGAPEKILGKSELKEEEVEKWKGRFHELARKGYRLVGFARKGEENLEEDIEEMVESGKLEWLGILVFEDPVRVDVKDSIEKLERAGIEFKVITGDFAETAEYVMENLGIEVGERKVLGEEFEEMSEKSQKKIVKEAVLFARFSPENKLRVVEILQEQERVVAMMGDGVNDAPALKKASVGVVVSEASEVSKETADMVLLDDDFSTVVEAVEEGRGIFENIRKVVLYLLSDSFSEVLLILGSIILNLPLPITAAQILWINLANDSFPALALTLEPLDEGLMEKGPRERKAHLVDAEMKSLMAIISGFTGLYVLGAFAWLLSQGHELSYARTVAFLFLGVDSLLYVFVAKSLDKQIWEIDFLGNIWLILGVLLGGVMQVAVLYVPLLQRWFGTHPLGVLEWGLVLGGAGVLIVSIELMKWFYQKKGRAG